MGKRVVVTLPDPLYEDLENWSNSEDRGIGTLAGELVADGIREAKTKGLIPESDKLRQALLKLAAGEFVSDKELGLLANQKELPLAALIKIRECLTPNGDHQHDHSPINQR